MRRLRYNVAVSLDGFIAGSGGEYDWIVMDEAIDFAALYREFDTALIGRRTFDVMRAHGESGDLPGIRVLVFSRTLPAAEHPTVTVTAEDPAVVVRALKSEPGRDIWLFGGGELFRYLLAAGLVDRIELAIMPVLLGQGVPVLPGLAHPQRLALAQHRVLTSGIVMLTYDVVSAAA